MNLSKLRFRGALALAVGVCFGTLAASGGNVIRLSHGGGTTDYESFAAGMSAAVNGDTLTLLDNIDAAPASVSVDKSVTIDLAGFKIANESGEQAHSHNMLFVNSGAQIVLKNGTLHSRWQSVLVPNSDNCSIALTNCVVSGNTMTYGGANDMTIRIGKGCVVTCGTLIYGGNGNTVVVEDGEIYSSTLRIGGSLVVQGGRFTQDPTAYVSGLYSVTQEKRTTDYGTTSYLVQPVTDYAAVVTRAGSGAEERFANFAAAFNAAANGDKITFNKDWVNPGAPFGITKAVTVDLNGHAISNTANANLLDVRATPVVFLNGTLSVMGQSAVVFNGGVQKAYMTNCVVAGATGSYSASAAELHVGAGCRFTCNAIASAHHDGSANSCRVNVFLEDDDIICAANKLFDNDNAAWSHVYVRGGTFKVNPSTCVVGDRKAVAEQTVTAYGTMSYKVVDRTGSETVVAGAVFPNGEVVKASSLADAASAARLDDTVRFFADVLSGGSHAINKRVTYDLNGHSFHNTVDANFIYANVDGCTLRNGTIESDKQSVLLPKENVTLYVTDCTVKGNTAVYSDVTNSCVVFTGGRIETLKVYSTHSSCKVKVEIIDSFCSNTSWPDNPGTVSSVDSSLTIWSCRSTIDPLDFMDKGSLVAPLTTSSGGTTYTYVAFKPEDASKYDLSSFEALGGQRYCASFADAYTAVPDCGVVKVLKDVSIKDGFSFNKTLTLDLGGHTLAQTGNSINFLMLYNGHVVTITGGGTIAKLPAGNSAFWIDGNAGSFELVSCRVTGSTFAYGSSGSVKLLSDDVVVESAALVSSHSTCKLTIVVEGGHIPQNIWDGGTPTGSNGGYVRALGGIWRQDPFALAALSAAFTVGDGLIARRDPADLLYTLVAVPDSIDADFSDTGYVAYSYTGTIPVTGAAITVNLAVSGEWDGRRKLLGDFSGLVNYDKLTFSLGTVPTGYDVPFKLSYKGGLLYAGLVRGSVLLIR